MKKILLVSMSAVLLFTSCGTYTGAGAVTGGSFGSIIGSAIGGIAGGRHGSNVGTLIGMAGGAAVGAAVGAAADNAQQRQYEDYQYNRSQRRTSSSSQRRYDYQDSYDSNGGGDDRLYGFDEHFTPSNKSTVQSAGADLEIRNPHLVDASRDGVLCRGEQARMVFEVFNNSSVPIYRVQPTVAEITGNRHIIVSQNVMVECIMPGKGIRYTAAIKADNRLKDGEAVFRIGVTQGNQEVSSQTREFPIITSK
jgi:uncharacterized protein YcfJ